MDDFAGGFAPGSGDLLRLIGSGFIAAFLIVGTTILAARALIGWQMRRFERMAAEKAGKAAQADKTSNNTTGSGEG